MIGYNEAEIGREAHLEDERRPGHCDDWTRTDFSIPDTTPGSKLRWRQYRWDGPDMLTPPYYQNGELEWRLER
jgi:hypothetical protein